LLAISAAPAGAALVGDVAACSSGGPALRIAVGGFKEARGSLRVRLYQQDGWLERGRSLSRLRVPVTASSMDLCVRVPGPGRYAVALHHDLNANRERDRSDGAGFSRNPKLSFIGRPSFAATSIGVGGGVTAISIQMLYIRGLTIGPARSS
jgi:uncharacterized protein (DUF2141 family)